MFNRLIIFPFYPILLTRINNIEAAHFINIADLIILSLGLNMYKVSDYWNCRFKLFRVGSGGVGWGRVGLFGSNSDYKAISVQLQLPIGTELGNMGTKNLAV